MRALAIALSAGLLAVVVAGCGSSSDSSSSSSGSKPKPVAAKLDAPALATPPKQAPSIILPDSNGKLIDVGQSYRGKSVLLMFIYSHCPDVCPLMVGNLHAALEQMSPAERAKTQIVAVSVDPKGDTPDEVNKFLEAHDMTGRMEYLIGSRRDLEPVWRKYGVQVEASPEDREQVGHSAFLYGITAKGQERALYPANFKPQWIVHDVPLLASA